MRTWMLLGLLAWASIGHAGYDWNTCRGDDAWQKMADKCAHPKFVCDPTLEVDLAGVYRKIDELKAVCRRQVPPLNFVFARTVKLDPHFRCKPPFVNGDGQTQQDCCWGKRCLWLFDAAAVQPFDIGTSGLITPVAP